jgi:hypothetical protein
MRCLEYMRDKMRRDAAGLHERKHHGIITNTFKNLPIKFGTLFVNSWLLIIKVVERYKVLFADNKAVAASKTDWQIKKTLNIRKKGDKKIIDWFIVYGDDETDAIRLADSVVTESFAKFLN